MASWGFYFEEHFPIQCRLLFWREYQKEEKYKEREYKYVCLYFNGLYLFSFSENILSIVNPAE